MLKTNSPSFITLFLSLFVFQWKTTLVNFDNTHVFVLATQQNLNPSADIPSSSSNAISTVNAPQRLSNSHHKESVAVSSVAGEFIDHVAHENTVSTVLLDSHNKRDQQSWKSPEGITNDGEGNIYVADFGDHAVKVIQEDRNQHLHIERLIDENSFKDSQQKFRWPSGIAMNIHTNVLYITEPSKNKIYLFNLTSNTLSHFAGTGEKGASDGPKEEATFHFPKSIAIDQERQWLYVADTSNSKIRLIDLNNGQVSTVAGGRVAGYRRGKLQNALFHHPHGVAVDRFGHVYVADTLNNKIRKINIISKLVETVAGRLEGGFQDGDSAEALFRKPEGLAVDRDGNIFVADTENHVIREISFDGKRVRTVVGHGRIGYKDGVGRETAFYHPTSLTVDNEKNVLYVSDTGNNVVRQVVLAKNRFWQQKMNENDLNHGCQMFSPQQNCFVQ